MALIESGKDGDCCFDFGMIEDFGWRKWNWLDGGVEEMDGGA